MKTFNKINILFIVIISIILLVSCSKSDISSKLQGKWKYVNVVDIDDTTYVEDWEFLSSGDLNIYYRDYEWGGNPDTITVKKWTAKYKMNTAKKFTISEFNNGHLPQYNTQWEIVRQKDKTLMIVNDEGGGLFFREFVKE